MKRNVGCNGPLTKLINSSTTDLKKKKRKLSTNLCCSGVGGTRTAWLASGRRSRITFTPLSPGADRAAGVVAREPSAGNATRHRAIQKSAPCLHRCAPKRVPLHHFRLRSVPPLIGDVPMYFYAFNTIICLCNLSVRYYDFTRILSNLYESGSSSIL